MKVSIIGTGNVATQLALGLEHRGFTVDEIYGRSPNHLKQLINKLYVAEGKHDLDFSQSSATAIFICVSDHSISEVSKMVLLPKKCLLIHTSGSVPLSVLHHDYTGIFYPLQSISIDKEINWEEVPLVISANDSYSLDVISSIAKKFSKNLYNYTDEQRKALHMAAVFGSNFTNHLLKIVKDISDGEGLDFHMFKNMVLNTVSKAFEIGPERGQTGPAKRGDVEVIHQHLEMLKGTQDLDKIYELMSKHIIQTYKK